MSENTDIPGIDGLVSAITGEDPGTYFIWLFHKFNAKSMVCNSVAEKTG